MIITKTKSTYRPFPGGVHSLRIDSVQRGTAQTSGRDYFRWSIRILDELPGDVAKDHKEPVFSILTPVELTEKNNFGKFLSTIGYSLDIGQSLDTDALVGYEFIAKVAIVAKNGKENNAIETVTIPEYEQYRRSHLIAA